MITFFAHATSTDNERRVCSGWTDVALSERGVTQARQLGEATRDLAFDIVVTSDLARAIETARLAWGARYRSVADARLRELDFGVYTQQSVEIIEPLMRGAITEPLPGGESFTQVKARVASFLTEQDARLQIAIVGHRATQLALDVLLRGLSWERALAEDWRARGAWQAGWRYELAALR